MRIKLASLVVIAAPPTALVAALLSSTALALPLMIGFLTASGVLAMAVCDYARPPDARFPCQRQPTPRIRPAAKPAPAGAPNTWGYRTASA